MMTARKHLKTLSLSALIFLFCLKCALAGIAPSNANQIRLGTFNVEKLGKSNLYQAKNAARILKNYDLVAIQEVMNYGAAKEKPLGDKGITALKQIVSYLREELGLKGYPICLKDIKTKERSSALKLMGKKRYK